MCRRGLAKGEPSAYLRAMLFQRKGYWRNVSPRGAVADLIEQWRQPTPYRWQILGVSIAATFTMMMVFLPESERAPPEKPKVTWITTFEAGRSDEEIIRSNIENQRLQDRLKAEREAREERRRENFRALARASGFDVEKLERQFSDPETTPARPAALPEAEPARATGE